MTKFELMEHAQDLHFLDVLLLADELGVELDEEQSVDEVGAVSAGKPCLCFESVQHPLKHLVGVLSLVFWKVLAEKFEVVDELYVEVATHLFAEHLQFFLEVPPAYKSQHFTQWLIWCFCFLVLSLEEKLDQLIDGDQRLQDSLQVVITSGFLHDSNDGCLLDFLKHCIVVFEEMLINLLAILTVGRLLLLIDKELQVVGLAD